MDNKYCDKKSGMVRRDCLQNSSINIGQSQKNVKRKLMQWKMDDIETVNRQVNFAVKENEKLF